MKTQEVLMMEPRATGNPFFLQTLDFLTQYLKAATRMTRANEARRVEFMRQVRDEHTAILEAIRGHNAIAARNAAATHMFNASRRLAVAEFEYPQDAAFHEPRLFSPQS